MKMKKLEISSIVFMGISVFFGILAVLMMFTPCLSVNSLVYSANSLFFDSLSGSRNGVITGFIGYMLIALGAITNFVFALPFIKTTIKVEKIVLISAIVEYVIGIILVMTMGVIYPKINPSAFQVSLLAGMYLTLSFTIISILATGIALKKDW